MGEATAPATRVPALGRIASAAAALVLLAAAGCGYADAPPWAGQGGEPAERWAAGGGGVNDPVDVACEVAAWIVDDALGIEAEPVEEPLSELVAEPGADGCRLAAVGSFADLPEDVETPVDLLWDSFEESGWHEDPRYATDTEEISAVGMWRGGVLCVAGAVWTWDGYGDLHAEYPEEDLLYDVMVECAPAEAPPIPRAGSAA